jgi:hypothetical protein
MNRRQLFLYILASVLWLVSPAQVQLNISDKAQISIITFGPYQPELYSAFGHSGIRVYDPERNIDWIYDYGRFSFKQENFYLNFAQGKMLYSIGRSKNFQRYKNLYIKEDRYVYEQVLNLSPDETRKFFAYLENNYLPENREYLYNYVYDNCATKIRDVLLAVVPSTQFNYDYITEGKTIRDLMDDYLDYQPWGDFAIDLGLGSQIDKEAEGDDYMFLPDYVFEAVSTATIEQDSLSIPLIRATNILYESSDSTISNGMFTPMNTFILLFFIVGLITNRDFKKQKRSHWLDVVLFTTIGIVGWWLVFLWFGTEHLSKNNWNLLWAFPFHLPLVFLLNKVRFQPILARVYRFLAVLHALTLVFWVLMPQPLHFALVPLLVLLVLRAFYISYDLSRI